MKKILFSLAALAAISLVAAGCKKASDAAKAEPEMQEITAVKTAFAALKKACDAANCKTEDNVKAICDTANNDNLLTKFEKAVTAAKTAKVQGADKVDLTDLKAKATVANLWDATANSNAGAVKSAGLQAVNDELKTLEGKVNALKAPAKK